MDCCRFTVSGEKQMRNDTNACVCAPAQRNEEMPAKKKCWSSVLQSTSQQQNKVLRDKSFEMFYFSIFPLYAERITTYIFLEQLM